MVREATTKRLTINGSRKRERPNPNPPTTRPITIPTIGKTYMNFAIVSKFELVDGNIVKNEKIEPISLSMNPPSKNP